MVVNPVVDGNVLIVGVIGVVGGGGSMLKLDGGPLMEEELEEEVMGVVCCTD